MIKVLPDFRSVSIPAPEQRYAENSRLAMLSRTAGVPIAGRSFLSHPGQAHFSRLFWALFGIGTENYALSAELELIGRTIRDNDPKHYFNL